MTHPITYKHFIFAMMIAIAMSFNFIPKATAQIVSPSTCSNCPLGSPVCIRAGSTDRTTQTLLNNLERTLQNQLNRFTDFFANAFDGFVGQTLTDINVIVEDQFIAWQNALIHVDLIPAMKDQTDQIQVSLASSSLSLNSGLDGVINNEAIRDISKIEAEAFAAQQPSEQVCIAASIAGNNLGRAAALERDFRKASEKQFNKRGSGNGAHKLADDPDGSGDDYGKGPLAHHAYQWDRYCTYLAKDTDNAGHNGCDVAPASTTALGMDTNPYVYFLNSKVIDVKDPAVEKGLEALKENLAAGAVADIIPASYLSGGSGPQAMMNLRSYLARQNAARAPIELIASRRLPTLSAEKTAGTVSLVKTLREQLGIPLSDIEGDDTSYKEIMSAMSREKFQSGTYNLDTLDSIENIERESLVLSVFYLMQLRDYYELMERTLLALAVQTSIEIGQDASTGDGTQ